MERVELDDVVRLVLMLVLVAMLVSIPFMAADTAARVNDYEKQIDRCVTVEQVTDIMAYVLSDGHLLDATKERLANYALDRIAEIKKVKK